MLASILLSCAILPVLLSWPFVFVTAQFDESDGRSSSHVISPAAYAAARSKGHAAHVLGHSRKASESAQAFVEHFSAQTTETSTYLYNLFRPSFSSNATSASTFTGGDSSANAALAYTVTKFPAEKLYRYLFSTDNAKHISLSPLADSDDDNIVYTQYVQSARKQLGGGVLGLDIKYAAWRLTWRGVVMDLYVTSWIESVYTLRSQTHIVVRSLPSDHGTFLSSLTPSPGPPSSSPTLAAQRSIADQAASLFLLELGDWTSSIKDAILVFEDSHWREDKDLWKNVQKADWEDVILDSGMKEGLKHEYRSFFKSEKVYKDLGVAWKRGIIFLGPPGNGKTITLKAMMKDAGVPVLYVKTFHTYGGDELGIRMVFERARQEAPCLLVFEDLDSLITENNRSFMLNEVDGLEDNDGMLMIGTTNHFDKLDPALSSRPSRFDRKYLFPNPTVDERAAYATYWRNKLSSNPRIEFPHSLIQTFADASHGFSFAYMKEVFVSTLLLLAGDEEHTLVFEKVLLEQVAVLRKELERGDAEGEGDAAKDKAKQEQRMFGIQSAMGGIGRQAAFRIG